MVVEARDDESALATVRLLAGAVGMLLALAVLASTVGLIRSESRDEVSTLTAVGADRRVRRGITAACAGSLAIRAMHAASRHLTAVAGRSTKSACGAVSADFARRAKGQYESIASKSRE